MSNKITPEFIEVFRMALAMGGLQMNTPTAELVVMLYDGASELGDSFSIKDVAKILAFISEKYPSTPEK